MREPKFVPGERVILESKHFQHLNGEYIIEHLFMHPSIRNVATGEMLGYGILYVLNGLRENGVDGWIESSLRKLPPETPATFDASIWVPNKESVK